METTQTRESPRMVCQRSQGPQAKAAIRGSPSPQTGPPSVSLMCSVREQEQPAGRVPQRQRSSGLQITASTVRSAVPPAAAQDHQRPEQGSIPPLSLKRGGGRRGKARKSGPAAVLKWNVAKRMSYGGKSWVTQIP